MFLSVLNENQYFNVFLTFVVSNTMRVDNLFYHCESHFHFHFLSSILIYLFLLHDFQRDDR